MNRLRTAIRLIAIRAEVYNAGVASGVTFEDEVVEALPFDSIDIAYAEAELATLSVENMEKACSVDQSAALTAPTRRVLFGIGLECKRLAKGGT